MLTPKVQLSLPQAKAYFREHLAVGDYYAQGQKVSGEWFGQGAEKLGLTGTAKEADFLALCEGLNPSTGKRLGARKNSRRRKADGGTVANRRVFYDFTISPPKSVSVVALMKDDRILALHRHAVQQALVELERFAAARVRKSGQYGDRETGNLVVATFRHDTSRELDPHLHTHCVILNATFDPTEHRWKALEVHGMYRAQKFAENLYYHELAKGLRRLGYEIENTTRDFEIKGVPQSVIARFSKRHQQIDAEAQKEIERTGRRKDVNALRRQIARDSRKRKMKESTADRLRPEWEKQVTRDESKSLDALRSVGPLRSSEDDAHAHVAWADEHVFSRRSVVAEYELLSESLARGRGSGFSLQDVRSAIEARRYHRETGTANLVAREVLTNELSVVMAAHDGRGRHAALLKTHTMDSRLNAEQHTAVETILSSRDFITVFRGRAGTGKSFTLKSIEQSLTQAGRTVIVLAPQRQQVRDLEKDGLPTQTLAQVLLKKKLPAGALVILDEAGQVGGKELAALVHLVKTHHCRLLLSGDTRQHGAVTASDALRAIERYADVTTATLREIRRQDETLAKSACERRFIRTYREAVKCAASGYVERSFDLLDKLGCVRECLVDSKGMQVAEAYHAALSQGHRAIAVAQTWDEVHATNAAIRAQLHSAGILKSLGTVAAFQPLNRDDAEKRDARFYAPGHHAVFLQRYGRYAKGDVCEILSADARGLVLLKNGRRSNFSYRYANRIIVTERRELDIAVNDRLQLKANGRSREGIPLNNGELVTVTRLHPEGDLIATNDKGQPVTLGPHQFIFTHGYTVTSYASQGKTVDTVLFTDSAGRAATSQNQWYVAISRARRNVQIFTNDKENLRANIARSGDRRLGLEALGFSIRDRAAWVRQQLRAAVEYVRLHAVTARAVKTVRQTRTVPTL